MMGSMFLAPESQHAFREDCHRLRWILLSLAMACLEIKAADPASIRSLNTERAAPGPMPALENAARSSLPPGFRLQVFAAEPDVHQPIAMALDTRGRLWVAENYSYSEQQVGFHPDARDRIVIFEDADQDGRFDRRTLFWDGAERLTSIEIGLGGVWAICAPQLVFIPDRNQDDVPDGAPEIMLDGFDTQSVRHNVANGLRWGPDGWLYGRHGILGKSMVGAPGAPEASRVSVNTGIWRFHPIRRVFERVAVGTTNPWGMDWDARGELFFINTVIGHLWHAIPGAHYRRMFGDDSDPHVYELIDQHADHVHWAQGENWTDVRKQLSDATMAAGGGHAHSGLLIYQGGQWPSEWNGKVLTLNFHGRKINRDRLERTGSGFTGRHEPDPVSFADPWFRGIDLLAAPDGSVFISDWSDAGECHDHDGIHRTSGRIYKLTYGQPARVPAPRDLDERALIGLLQGANEGLARLARREWINRAHRGAAPESSRTALKSLALNATDEIIRLRAAWTLHGTGSLDTELWKRMLRGGEYERVWALMLGEDRSCTDPGFAETFGPFVSSELISMAETESSARVRLAMASLLQRPALKSAAGLARALLKRGEDAKDHNLPLMLWYGVKERAATDPSFVEMILEARLPKVQQLAARRLAEEIDQAPQGLERLLAGAQKGIPDEALHAILDGIADGFAGRYRIPKPGGWDRWAQAWENHSLEAIRTRVKDLNALFGDGRALAEIRKVALSGAADFPRRRAALRSLIEARSPDLRAVCESLLGTRDLSAVAARGMALFDDDTVATRLLEEWPKLYGHERPEFLNALLSRPAWASRVLQAMSSGAFRKTDLSPAHAAHIRAFRNDALTQKLAEVWGTVQSVDEKERGQALAKWRARLLPSEGRSGEARAGEQVYVRACGSCHRLFDVGTSLAPDLTGSGRQNLDYLLENILFPSAVVPAEYRQTTLVLKDGRSLTGVVRGRGARTLTLEMAGQSATVDRTDIAKEEFSTLSMMPEGILEQLTEQETRDLMAFLMSPAPPRRP